VASDEKNSTVRATGEALFIAAWIVAEFKPMTSWAARRGVTTGGKLPARRQLVLLPSLIEVGWGVDIVRNQHGGEITVRPSESDRLR
jgi:hypothetical protein